jgi:hypothetical protein
VSPADQFAFVAVTTDTLLGVAMPDTIAGVLSLGGGGVGEFDTGGEVSAVPPEPPLHALSNVTSVTAQRPRPNLPLTTTMNAPTCYAKGVVRTAAGNGESFRPENANR